MAEPKTKKLFPKDFFWGASTASHQVEGGTYNQWTVWELAHAAQLAKNAEYAKPAGFQLQELPNWEDIKPQAKNPHNYVSGEGVDHYHRYKEDFEMAHKLNLNAFRFGIEWARIEPEEGQWDKAEIEHYRRYIRAMRAKGLEPFLNIWHWTVPTWFADIGGFSKRRNLKYFERFVEILAAELADEITYVITLNEPNVYATFSYLIGEWVPQERNPLKFIWTYLNLAAAHRRSYRILKRYKPSLHIGVAQAMANIQAKRPHNILDEITTKVMRYWWNWWFMERIKRYQDYTGFNYYFTDYYQGLGRRENPTVPLNDLGWYMEPEGLYPLLLRCWTRFKKPVFVLENGVADSQDAHRRWWLEETMVAMERALSEGVDLRGYFHWSLLDNFEWKFGWWPKFGLVAVDREHGMKRTVRPSAKWWAERLKAERASN